MNCKRWAMSFMNWCTGLYDRQAVSLWSNLQHDQMQGTRCYRQGLKMSLVPHIFLFIPGEWCTVHTRWAVHSSHQVSGAQFIPGEWCTVHTRWVVHSSHQVSGAQFTPGECCTVHTRWVVHSSHQVSGSQFTQSSRQKKRTE
jgi:hypothetical protein